MLVDFKDLFMIIKQVRPNDPNSILGYAFAQYDNQDDKNSDCNARVLKMFNAVSTNLSISEVYSMVHQWLYPSSGVAPFSSIF